jgi:hypothetical protein
VRMAGASSEIRAEHLSNASLETYCYANPRRVSVVIKAWILNSRTPEAMLRMSVGSLNTNINIGS